MRVLLLSCVAALVAAAGPVSAVDEIVIIKAGRIITGTGDEIRDGVIVIKGGRIEAVGKNLDAPWEGRVIDASDKVVIPGFIEAHATRGVDRPNENVPSVPYVSTFDAVNPLDPYFEECLRQGITTVFVSPGNGTMIGGQGCVLKPAGVTVEAMNVVKNHAMKLSLQPRGGASRMAHVAALRRELDEMLEYLQGLEEKKGEVPVAAGGKGAGAKPEIEVKREAMARLLQAKMPALVYCDTSSDVLRAIELSKRYKFRMKLVLGRETWRAAPDIAQEKLEVILPADMIFWETDDTRHEEVLRVLPTVFFKAGIPFAFQTDGSSLGAGYLWYQAASAVRHGLPRAEAIKAATLNPARILGLADRLGSLEKGKDGNLVVLTGDPLDAQTWVDQVLIEGSVVYERSKDAKLQRVLKATPEKK